MASYYDEYNYYGEPDYYGGSVTYQEPNNYDHHQPNIDYEEPNNYEEPQPQYYEELQPQYYEELQPQYYENVPPHCHAGLEPADDELGNEEPNNCEDASYFHASPKPTGDEREYENWPTYDDMILRLPCYEDLHPIYQDHVEGLGNCAVEEGRDDEGHGSKKSVEYPPHPPSLDNVTDNVCPSGWVNPDPNDELSDEEWEALVAEHNAAENAADNARERELEEYFAVLNSMDPLEQDELKRRIDLLAVDEDMDNLHTFYRLFLNALNLMAAEKSPLFSLETMAPPPPPPPHTASTVP